MITYYATDDDLAVLRWDEGNDVFVHRYDYHRHDWVEDDRLNMFGDFYMELHKVTEEEADRLIKWNEERVAGRSG